MRAQQNHSHAPAISTGLRTLLAGVLIGFVLGFFWGDVLSIFGWRH